MFRYKNILIWMILFNILAARVAAQTIQTPSNEPASKKKFTSSNHFVVSLSYISWQETVQLNNGSLTDHASSSFYGYSLGLMWEHFFLLRHGFAILGQGLSGHAGFGNGVQGQITEHFDGTPSWWGLLLSANYVYRLSSSICLLLGPIVLSRFVSIPSQPSGSPKQNFSSEDIGFVASLRLRLFAGVELQQTLGSLTNQASTIWSLGLGYRF